MAREYPERPVLAVGVVLLDGDEVLLVERARPPSAGRWTVPGGGVEAGESMRAAAARELREETGLEATLGPIVEVLERIVADERGRPLYHYVIVDFLGTEPRGTLAARSDAAAARFVPFAELARLPLTDDLVPVIERARAIRDGAATPPYEPGAPLRR
jgi:8-oxo-dGTP diphosphatase